MGNDWADGGIPASQCRVLKLESPYMRGNDVLAVQQALVSKGFNPGPIDGIYGPLTASAVTSFEASRSLPQTGVVCGDTYRLLGVICPAYPPCPPGPSFCRALVTTEPLMWGADVTAVQEALKARGFDPGPVDGVYGPRTASAVRRFQTSRAMTPSGIVCGDTYRVLGISCPTYPSCPPSLIRPGKCRVLVLTTPFMTGSDVAAVQLTLANRGFGIRVVDGIYGPETAAVVAAFNAAAGITGQAADIVCAATYLALAVACPSYPFCPSG
ncbi:MAG: peptidoglycan-binding protein [Bacillota bacterium]|jgi:peptidoglycan hydrolase-like protein with peptidoglycan-binding domain